MAEELRREFIELCSRSIETMIKLRRKLINFAVVPDILEEFNNIPLIWKRICPTRQLEATVMHLSQSRRSLVAMIVHQD